MLDFNNPYLGVQEKKDMLALEVSREYRDEKRLMAEAGMPYSSPSYWVLTIGEFIELAKASKSLETLFSGELKENLYYPNYQVLLMEHDRVEAGEWDNFYQRFAPIGYQNICVIGVNGFLEGEVPKSNEEVLSKDFNSGIWRPSAEEVLEQIKDYEETFYWSKNENSFFPIGIWDIPIIELNQYEEQRVWKRTYYFSQYFELLMAKELQRHKKSHIKLLEKKAKKFNQEASKGFTHLSSNKHKLKKKNGGKKK
jgi:hypothetical protein